MAIRLSLNRRHRVLPTGPCCGAEPIHTPGGRIRFHSLWERLCLVCPRVLLQARREIDGSRTGHRPDRRDRCVSESVSPGCSVWTRATYKELPAWLVRSSEGRGQVIRQPRSREGGRVPAWRLE